MSGELPADPQQPELLRVCRIGRAQGLKGEVTVRIFTDEPEERFAPGAELFNRDGSVTYTVERARTFKNRWYLKLEGVDDRNAAEGLRGAFMEIERDDAVTPAADEFFISELIGAALFARGDGGETQIGVIRAVDSFGAADVFSVECADGAEMTFAFVKALDAAFDGERKRLSVDGARLAEVAVYED